MKKSKGWVFLLLTIGLVANVCAASRTITCHKGEDKRSVKISLNAWEGCKFLEDNWRECNGIAADDTSVIAFENPNTDEKYILKAHLLYDIRSSKETSAPPLLETNDHGAYLSGTEILGCEKTHIDALYPAEKFYTQKMFNILRNPRHVRDDEKIYFRSIYSVLIPKGKTHQLPRNLFFASELYPINKSILGLYTTATPEAYVVVTVSMESRYQNYFNGSIVNFNCPRYWPSAQQYYTTSVY
ncbi:MAG: hypothetical protein P0S94_05580 [Simkaniaceae bacterium]|nr:hypothetical protein [Simkaniaceae bacterium]